MLGIIRSYKVSAKSLAPRYLQSCWKDRICPETTMTERERRGPPEHSQLNYSLRKYASKWILPFANYEERRRRTRP